MSYFGFYLAIELYHKAINESANGYQYQIILNKFSINGKI